MSKDLNDSAFPTENTHSSERGLTVQQYTYIEMVKAVVSSGKYEKDQLVIDSDEIEKTAKLLTDKVLLTLGLTVKK